MTVRRFHCRVFNASLTSETCAKRRCSSGSARSDDACKRCEVGEAHQRGESPATWPDGLPVVELEAPTRGQASVSVGQAPYSPRARTAPASARRYYTHQGETLHVAEWARRLGIHPRTFWMRVRRHGVVMAIEMGGPNGRAEVVRARRALPSAAARVARALKKAGMIVIEVRETGAELVVRCTP